MRDLSKLERVKTVDQLVLLAEHKRSVIRGGRDFYGRPHRPMPAAFMLNMSAINVNNFLKLGLFVYIPGQRKPMAWSRSKVAQLK